MGSPFEDQLRQTLEKEGWKVFHKGYPDFICFKGNEVKFIEAKDNGDKLQEHQKEVISLMKAAGLNVEVWYNKIIEIDTGKAREAIPEKEVRVIVLRCLLAMITKPDWYKFKSVYDSVQGRYPQLTKHMIYSALEPCFFIWPERLVSAKRFYTSPKKVLEAFMLL